MKTITIERYIEAPLEKVWSVAADFSKAPGPTISVTVEKEGDRDRHGVGLERTVICDKLRVCERIETVEPMQSFSYRIISGSPVRSYLGKVEFKREGNATCLRWSCTFAPKIPGTGWIIASITRKVITRAMEEIDAACCGE